MQDSVSDRSGAFQEGFFAWCAGFVRRWTAHVLNTVMEIEQMTFLGCVRHERTQERRGWRNGYDPLDGWTHAGAA